MPQHRAVPVMLSARERKTLKKRVRGAKTAHRDRLRAQIVLAAARGRASARIAADLQISVDTVRKWRGRFAARGLDGLTDLPRSRAPAADQRADPGRGRRAGLPAARRHRGTAVALDRPGTGRRADQARAWPAPMSPSSVLRILAEHPVKPWQYQSWISPPRPGLRREGHRHPRPVPGVLPGQAAAARRPHPVAWTPSRPSRPAPLCHATRPPHPAGRCASSTNTSATAPSPCWPPSTCAPARCSPPPPAHHRDRPVHGPDGPGHEPPSRTTARPGCSSSWTTAPTTAARRPPGGCATPTERDHDPHAGPRLLAEPGGNLLLRHPEESHHPQRLRQPGQLAATLLAFVTATTPSPGRSTGSSPRRPHRLSLHQRIERPRQNPTSRPWQPDLPPTNLRA